MSLIANPYYTRPEVSNSTLTEIEKYWLPQAYIIDLKAVFRFGSLVDALITEPTIVDYFRLTVGDEQYTQDEFAQADQMKKAFYADSLCAALAKQSEMQKVTIRPNFPINYNKLRFCLDMRCRWDFFCKNIDLSGDLKSTACTTQKAFEESIRHYSYDRQAALYMDLEGKNNFMFIGISKVNMKVFRVPVKRDSELFRQGRAKYEDLAFKWITLYGDLSKVERIAA